MDNVQRLPSRGGMTTPYTGKAYGSSGWRSFRLQNEALMKKVESQKNLILTACCKAVESQTGQSLTTFDTKFLKEFEIAKSAFRALLRYDSTTSETALTAARWVNQNLSDGNTAVFVNRPYPIIHFPNDSSEQDGMHVDGTKDIPEFHNIWIPINDCFHKPISVVERSHPWLSRMINRGMVKLRAKLKTTKIPDHFGKVIYPTATLGTGFVWHGYTAHKGNLNQTDKPTSALVIKVTNIPMLHEPIHRLDSKNQTVDPYAVTENEATQFTLQYLRLLSDIESHFKNFSTHKVSPVELFNQMTKQIQSWSLPPDISDRTRRQYSFALSLYVQRMAKAGVMNLWFWDLYAAALGQDNLICLVRALEFLCKPENSTQAEVFALITAYFNKMGSAQAEYLIENLSKRTPSLNGWRSALSQPSYPVLEWL